MCVMKKVRKELASAVNTPEVRATARRYYREIKDLPKERILLLCDELLEEDKWEERTVAFQWAHRLKKRYGAEDMGRFERWMDDHVKGWGACDDLCTHALGELVYQYPELVPKVEAWTSSDNMWKRRGAAVVMVYCVHRGEYLDSVFSIADALLRDEEDLVLKGYGWMLKVASCKYPEAVYDYVLENKTGMPRLALRYAVEKMPEDMRKNAMKRD